MSGEPSSEDDLIATYFAPIAGLGGLGLRDDAARMEIPAGDELVVTNDALVAGVHFLADDPPETVARKALRVNLSDLAAKGAEPLGFLLALALPDGWTRDWLAAFTRGLGEDAGAYACPLVGGDTVRTPGPLVLSITLLGSVPAGRLVPRTGVRPGDRLYVSGSIGDAALGLKARADDPADAGWLAAIGAPHRAALVERYRVPRPRTALTQAMRAFASAGMDVSDGFVGDLAKMLRVSGVGAEIELAAVPLSAAAEAAVACSPPLFDVVMTGGDDYELLAAVAPERAGAFEAAAAAAGVPVARVGTARAAGEPVVFRDAEGRPRRFAHGAFSHF